MYKYSQVQETVFTANQKSFTLNNFSNMKLADADNGFETVREQSLCHYFTYKAVMFDADMVVLYQVLYETTQQIVSDKGSLTIRTHF